MIEWLGVFGQLPVLHQLVPVELTPSEDELQLAERQRAPDDTSILNVNQGFVPCILRVKVGWVVVAVKHGDSDSVKQADFRPTILSF